MPASDLTPRAPSPRRLALLAATGLVLSVGCGTDRLGDAANRDLLETLPRDRRVDLQDDLHRFDTLPMGEQAAIRRLDAALGTEKPDDQARYRALIQHYHVWFQGLTEEQQATLRATDDPEERSRLARQLRLAGVDKGRRPGSRIARLRSGNFGLIAPFDLASLLQTWFALPAERRVSLDRKPWPALREELRTERKALKIRPEVLPSDLEKRYDAELEADREFRPIIEWRVGRVKQATNNGKVEAAKKAEVALRGDEHAFAEFLYFDEHLPKAVAADRLARFADACPEWLHVQTDSLASDDAQSYYAILYRLIYPSPKEIAEAVPVPGKPAPARGTPPRSGPANPVF